MINESLLFVRAGFGKGFSVAVYQRQETEKYKRK